MLDKSSIKIDSKTIADRENAIKRNKFETIDDNKHLFGKISSSIADGEDRQHESLS